MTYTQDEEQKQEKLNFLDDDSFEFGDILDTNEEKQNINMKNMQEKQENKTTGEGQESQEGRANKEKQSFDETNTNYDDLGENKGKDVYDEKKEQQIEALMQKLTRVQADYANAIKRQEREKQDDQFFITKKTILKILPFIDNLERAMNVMPKELENNEWAQGIRSMYTGIIKSIGELGVTPFESVGQELNPEYHEVMSQGPGPEGKIIQEFEKGYYYYNEKIIRHAKVIVGIGK